MALSREKIAHFESIGPAAVKREIAEGKHGLAPDSPHWREAELWVEAEIIKRESEFADKCDLREERTLAIAEDALSNSRRANKIAIIAIVLSAMMAILQIIK